MLNREDFFHDVAQSSKTHKKNAAVFPVYIHNELYYIGRVEIPISPLNLSYWLKEQLCFPKVFFSSREKSLAIAASGSIFSLANVPDIRFSKPIEGETITKPRFFGGHAFSYSKRMDDLWKNFADNHWILPRIEIIEQKDQFYLAVNAISQNLLHIKDFVLSCSPTPPVHNDAIRLSPISKCVSREDFPNYSDLQAYIEKIQKAIASNYVSKAVAARLTKLTFAENISPFEILYALQKQAVGCYTYGLQFSPSAAFIGASPELLFRKEGLNIQSELMAGTVPRGLTHKEDADLGKQLLLSTKDHSETQSIEIYLAKILDKICHTYDFPKEKTLYKTSNVQHLYLPYKGQLKQDLSPSSILRLIHPTPAVCGFPKEKALSLILDSEPFDRGWYAAPIGWIGDQEAEFTVAIRSALVRENNVYLFSGGGIVEKSTPDREWDEREYKIQPFLKILKAYDRQDLRAKSKMG